MVGGLTEEERKELSDVLGQLVAYFVAAAHDARVELEATKRRNAFLEELVARYRQDGVGRTNLSVAS